MKRYFLFFLLFISLYASAQNTGNLKVFRIYSRYTAFPDTGRANGHLYHNTLYDAATHYSDSSVLILVPPAFKPDQTVDLIFWFHGWGNNIDSALLRYQLYRQFDASHQNAVLVLAETAWNAPDSYGGKLETNGVFKNIVGDVLSSLRKEKIIAPKAAAGNIFLAGHSGAYRVIANILQNGDMPVKETILFDALYGETDKYMNWIKADTLHRYINIYTDSGGTDGETRKMMEQLSQAGVAYYFTEENALTPQMLKSNRLVFIHTPRQHNDIICTPDNFLLFISNTPFLKKY